MALAQLAIEDVASCDFDGQKRLKKLEEEAEDLRQHVASMKWRLERAEGMLGQLLGMMMRGQTDPSAVRTASPPH